LRPAAAAAAQHTQHANTGCVLLLLLLPLNTHNTPTLLLLLLLPLNAHNTPTLRYDGQTFVKPPEVLTRDRLLATYTTKPIMAKLRQTLLGAGGILLASSLLLVGDRKSVG
jgi:hypothetical protein